LLQDFCENYLNTAAVIRHRIHNTDLIHEYAAGAFMYSWHRKNRRGR